MTRESRTRPSCAPLSSTVPPAPSWPEAARCSGVRARLPPRTGGLPPSTRTIPTTCSSRAAGNASRRTRMGRGAASSTCALPLNESSPCRSTPRPCLRARPLPHHCPRAHSGRSTRTWCSSWCRAGRAHSIWSRGWRRRGRPSWPSSTREVRRSRYTASLWAARTRSRRRWRRLAFKIPQMQRGTATPSEASAIKTRVRERQTCQAAIPAAAPEARG